MVTLTCFLLLVVPLVAYCAWRVPLGQVPDESTHVARAESVLHGQIIGHRVATPNAATGAPDAGVTGNIGLALAADAGNGARAPLPASATAAARLAWAEAIPWAPAPTFISCVNTAAYAPIAYIPAALALGLATSLGARPHAAAIAARFGNVFAFAILGALALLLAGRGRLLLLVTLSLPMTIWLAGSCNQDGILIAVATLALALLTRATPASFWCGSALLAVLALQKPPFVTLMLLPLVVPGVTRAEWPQRLGAALLITLPALLWSAAVMHSVSVPLLPGAPYHPGPLWPGDPHRLFRSAIAPAQILVILHHPLTVGLLPLTKPNPSFTSLWLQLLGVLGPFTIRLPGVLYTLFTLALLSAAGALLTGEPKLAGKRWASAVAFVAILGCVELIHLVQYLTWTPVGADRIDGVQGRYFLPLLPVLSILLNQIIPIPKRIGWVWWVAPLAAIIALDISLPGIIAQHYGR
jgi:uncharacterized membrane protein